MEFRIFGKILSFTNTPPTKKEEVTKQDFTILKNDVEGIVNFLVDEIKKPKVKTLYQKAEKNLIVVYGEDVLQGIITDEAVIELIKVAGSKQEIQALLDSQKPKKEEPVDERELENEQEQEREIVSNYLDIFEGSRDFEVVEKKVFFKGIRSIEIPSLIVANFIQLIQDNPVEPDEEYEALKMFTLKLLCNPIEQSREQLLNFVRKNDCRITSTGNITLYRRANRAKDEKTDFVEFVSSQYLKVKGWKKSPKNYWVWGNDDGSFTLLDYNAKNTGIESNMGNLYDLYVNLPKLEENLFVAQHKGAMKFKIGDVYKIEEQEVDLNADVCHAGGLHAACVDYDYSGYGNVSLCVLVNPSKAITVPYEDCGKLRCSEMFILGVHENEGQHISEESVHTFDEQYHNYSLEELESVLKTRSVAPVSISEAVSKLSIPEVANITEKLKQRVVLV